MNICYMVFQGQDWVNVLHKKKYNCSSRGVTVVETLFTK